jgi:long-chain fatty acid transport protein
MASAALAEFSPFSYRAEALGMPVSQTGARERALGEGGLAAVSNKGFALTNISRSAFYEKTAFIATLEGDGTWLRDGDGNSSRIGTSTFPTLATHIKTKKVGTFGAYYQQTHMRRYEVASPEGSDPYETHEYEGGMYLLGLSWAYAPVPWMALGVSQNFAIGRDRTIHSADFALEDSEDLPGDTLEVQRQGWFPSVSATFRTRPVDLAVSYTHSANLSMKSERHTYGQSNDPVENGPSVDMPKIVALGAAWKIAPRKVATADFSYEAWESVGAVNPAWQAGLGYELRGTDSPFDAYWERTSWRAGGGYKVLYLEETPELFATLGAGFPLGPRGHVIDVSLKYGHRSYDGVTSFTEDYVKLSASIVGVSVWGQPARKRR